MVFASTLTPHLQQLLYHVVEVETRRDISLPAPGNLTPDELMGNGHGPSQHHSHLSQAQCALTKKTIHLRRISLLTLKRSHTLLAGQGYHLADKANECLP